VFRINRSRLPWTQWTPPPGWPEPPRNWVPPAGWEPDPAWPAPPEGHEWWQTRTRGRFVIGGFIGAALLVLSGCGAFIALANSDDGCGFDPPPGDYSSIAILNDTAQALSVVQCNDEQCTTYLDDTLDPVSAGKSGNEQYESCNGARSGLLDTDGNLVGCLDFPIGEPSPVPYLRMSAAGDCDGGVGSHPTASNPA
jgi:hypothetical protein